MTLATEELITKSIHYIIHIFMKKGSLRQAIYKTSTDQIHGKNVPRIVQEELMHQSMDTGFIPMRVDMCTVNKFSIFMQVRQVFYF
jgi:hypothetical protein